MTATTVGNPPWKRKISALFRQIVGQWNSYWKWIGGAGITVKILLHIYSTLTTGDDGIKLSDIFHLLVVLLLVFLFFAVYTTIRFVLAEPKIPFTMLTDTRERLFTRQDGILALFVGALLILTFSMVLYLDRDVRFFLLHLPQVSDCSPVTRVVPRAIIANIAEADASDTLLWEEEIYDKILTDVQPASPFQVCRLEVAPRNITQALNAVRLHEGFVLVWGRHQPSLTQISISLPSFKADQISPLSIHAAEWPSALDYTLILRSVDKIAVVVDLIAAHQLSENNQFEEAYGILDNLIEDNTLDEMLASADADFYFWVGMLYHQSSFEENRIKRAVDYYSEAIRQDNTYWLAYLNRAAAYDSLDQPAEARGDLEMLIASTEPQFQFDGYIGRAIIYAHEGDIQRAAADYDAAVQIDRLNGLLERGRFWLNVGDLQAAVRDLDSAWKLAPDNPDAIVWHIMANVEAGNEQVVVDTVQHWADKLDEDHLELLRVLLRIAGEEQISIAPTIENLLPTPD